RRIVFLSVKAEPQRAFICRISIFGFTTPYFFTNGYILSNDSLKFLCAFSRYHCSNKFSLRVRFSKSFTYMYINPRKYLTVSSFSAFSTRKRYCFPKYLKVSPLTYSRSLLFMG